jgi:DNA-binding IclR family transcriptional regulator
MLAPPFPEPGSDRSMTQAHVTQRARGVDRAVHILDYLQTQKRPLRPNEIAQGIGAPKSTVYDIINLLLDQHILEYYDREGRVFLGRKLYFFGQSYLKQFDLARESEEHLVHIAEVTKETAQMCMLEGHKYTVAMMREGERHFRISSDIGEQVAIPWTASGRLLVSHMTDREILDFIPEADFVLPDGTSLDPQLFLSQVHAARDDGFFSFDSVADTFTHCFAAPVHDEAGQCIATLCLIAPRADAARNHGDYRAVLTGSAARLSEKLAGEGSRHARRTGSGQGRA